MQEPVAQSTAAMATSVESIKGTVRRPGDSKMSSEHCQPSPTVDPAARQSHESAVGATASARPARTPTA
eukprot:4705334-Prymnesium_polylepis.1